MLNTLNKHLAPPTPSSSGRGTPGQISSAVLTCDECRSKWRRLHALLWPNGRRWTWGDVGTPPATAWARNDPCPCRGGSRHAGIPRRSTAARGWGVQNPVYLRQCCNKEKSVTVDKVNVAKDNDCTLFLQVLVQEKIVSNKTHRTQWLLNAVHSLTLSNCSLNTSMKTDVVG